MTIHENDIIIIKNQKFEHTHDLKEILRMSSISQCFINWYKKINRHKFLSRLWCPRTCLIKMDNGKAAPTRGVLVAHKDLNGLECKFRTHITFKVTFVVYKLGLHPLKD